MQLFVLYLMAKSLQAAFCLTPIRLSQLLFLYILLKAIKSGKPAEQKQWDGADTLEWTHLPTPMPYHTFENPPTVK